MPYRTVFRSAIFTVLLCLGMTASADISLPAPHTSGGTGIYDALKARHSANLAHFPQKALSLQDLSDLLWAATGLNRQGKGWTTPYAMGMAPYNKIYIVSDKGISLYDWQNHALKPISEKDIRSMIGKQAGVATAPVILVITSDSKAIGNITGSRARDWAHIASGAMAQNLYLAAASLNIGARYIVSMNEDIIRKELKLDKDDLPINIMPLGKN